MSPWMREWVQQELDIEADSGGLIRFFAAVVLLVLIVMAMSLLFADGMVAEAELAQARAEGQRMGRLELLQRIDRETDKEGQTWLAYYRAASQPALSGFDGVMLAESACRSEQTSSKNTRRLE